MTSIVAPPLVVRLGDAMFTFTAGKEVVVGRGESADIRVDAGSENKQAISRAHMVVRADRGQWVATDNSRNGIYVGGHRVPKVAVEDGIVIALGAADGPRLVFKTATQPVPAASLAKAAGTPRPAPPSGPLPRPPMASPPPRQPVRPSPPPDSPSWAPPRGGPAPSRQPEVAPQRPAAPRPERRDLPPPAAVGRPVERNLRTPAFPPTPPLREPAPSTPAQPRVLPHPSSEVHKADALAKVTGIVKKVMPQRSAGGVPPGAITIGRLSTSAIRVDDPLISRTHAYLLPAPTGWQIHDNASNNGVFVNGVRVPAATLQTGDVVTIGNTDLVFTGTTLQPSIAAAIDGGLQADHVGLTIDGYQLLTDVSFTARPGTLTAVIGPSGAGKSTLIKLLSGATSPTAGQVSFGGHDVHSHYASMRSRIGVVPQDDVVHRQLTVDQALNYAAKLRLPADTNKTDRRSVVESVLSELELTQHRAKRVDKLSGGQRKRASVAMELLTGPSLLILDEPTSGLDPALDRQVMSMLRTLADAGRTVIVVTHSLTYLSMCDQVLLLAPGGKTAYAGPPDQVEAAMGTSDWADIFAWVSAKPDDAYAVFRYKNPAAAQPAPPPAPAGPLGEPARSSFSQQVLTLMGRQLRLIVADRGYTLFLALLPLVMGALCLVVPGHVGLGVASANGGAGDEPAQLLVVMIIAAVFMGTALTIRDLVGERNIYRREQSVGLSARAYLTSKTVVFSVAAAVQTAVVVAIVVTLKGGPGRGAVALGNPIADLYAALALTAIVSAIVGLLLSALARSSDWVMPMLVVMIMSAIVFSGGLIPVTGRAGLNQLSYLLPVRWGFAAGASSIDLMTADALNTVDDPLWRHQLSWWLIDIGVLFALGVAATAAVSRLLRLPRADGEKAKAGGRIVSVVSVLVVLGGFITGMSYLTRGGHTRDHAAGPDLSGMPTQGTAPPRKPVANGEAGGLLPDAQTVSAVMGTAMTVTGRERATDLSPAATAPPQCVGVAAAGSAHAYGTTGVTAVAGTTFSGPDPNISATEWVLVYPDADRAASVDSDQVNTWMPCAHNTASLTDPGRQSAPVTVGAVTVPKGRVAADVTVDGATCRHVLGAASNIVVDVMTCSPSGREQSDALVSKIVEKAH